MMSFLGIDVAEWAALISIISAFGGILVWLLKTFIFNPLNDQIMNLSDSIKQLNKSNNERYEQQQQHLTHEDDRLDKHDVKLENHDTRITNLENLNDIRKENAHEHESNN